MSTILAIETSGKYCSVALIHEGLAEFSREDEVEMNHARAIGPFVDECVKEARRREWKIDAVAVSMGPGSYTGLRIGLSMAKGLCFSLGVPLIGVSTLKLIAVKAMFRNIDWQGDEILVPMIDARRMEVYTAAYDFRLNALMEPQPLILTDESYSELPTDRSIFFMGDGAEKSKDVLKGEGRHWIDGVNPKASDMTALAEKAFREGDFLDVAYSVPEYLKEYEAKKSAVKGLS
ncbi:MAG: tRNA (adenosine(37)-N6)-threonylcarbamoyltransferase complex dimerization subunit type 1 TsaB [Muribaculaceae bacterium]|nr:tRNA (adenosine(37)-N6)-threonylcarbamoyltransferase complex dimerization subunit type 1 TsaB [Bacteroides sp.]MBD5419767.1 tRNA (adenosine(37)-N6)-threonylcarbamoyltransferase complex dimerization subunit type 1 TsaB [Bacteroides sp.]MDE6194575.1 tRNA (adenosine(37)-N6)-threonylcarbamoyltransferase complex dimerization subunit type 1 TsaB [Muribaculaceae bacterium]